MKQLILALSLWSAAVWAAEPAVTNVSAEQRTDGMVVIHYDVADDEGDALNVRVEVSADGGAHFLVPARSFSGDVGDGITSGAGKEIVWDAPRDWDGEYSERMVVQVIATDTVGFPGLEWTDEIVPSGFLLGQDGGAEGSGPARHVHIPYSYRLSTREITRQQYCDFLNEALNAGKVERSGTTAVMAAYNFEGVAKGAKLCTLSDNNLRWNVSHFDVAEGYADFPAVVTWSGALLFCHTYGYDLPTTAEWEKAARGPDHDDEAEHLCFPWGDTFDDTYSTGSSTLLAVGSYPANDYGLYDMAGNVGEWTRTLGANFSPEAYPKREVVEGDLQALASGGARLARGLHTQPLWQWQAVNPGNAWAGSVPMGFRPVQRNGSDSRIEKLNNLQLAYVWRGSDFQAAYDAAGLAYSTSPTQLTVKGVTWRTSGITLNASSPAVVLKGAGAVPLSTLEAIDQAKTLRVAVRNPNSAAAQLAFLSGSTSVEVQLPANMSNVGFVYFDFPEGFTDFSLTADTAGVEIEEMALWVAQGTSVTPPSAVTLVSYDFAHWPIGTVPNAEINFDGELWQCTNLQIQAGAGYSGGNALVMSAGSKVRLPTTLPYTRLKELRVYVKNTSATTSTWLMMSAGGTPIGENEFAANMAAFEAYSFIYSGNAANYHGETEFTLEVSSTPDSWLLISRIELIFQSN